MKGQTGTIFGIQKFSIHDGPGIRTVVFFKGCPLRCIWCHNPEGISPKIQLRKTSDSAEMNNDLADELAKINRCKQSLKDHPQMEHFAQNGFELVGNFVSVDEILQEVMKDRNYFAKSGGGLTVSGGEPTFQPDFLIQLLKRAKALGIHTCLETCGYASNKTMQELAPYVDLFLYDIKETDDQKSKTLIGVGNERILSVLALLDRLEAKIVLRCPIIPTLNDRSDHFTKIADLTQKYQSVIGCEIMPYHNYGVSKARKVDYPFIEEFTVPTKEAVKIWEQQLLKEGGKLVDWKTLSLHYTR